MSLCEFRLYNHRGSLILLYHAVCETDARRLERLQSLSAVPYYRLELWRGETLLIEQIQASAQKLLASPVASAAPTLRSPAKEHFFDQRVRFQDNYDGAII
jgi:hypothetical protein